VAGGAGRGGAGGTAGAAGAAGRGGTGGASGAGGQAGRGGTGGGSGGRGGTGGAPCGDIGQMCCRGDGGNVCNAGLMCLDSGNVLNICVTSGLGGRGGQSGAGGAGGSPACAAPPCFACGPSVSCSVDAQYCLQFSSGVPSNPPTYTCLTTPSACEPTPTCGCLQGQGIAGAATCTESAPGALKVTLAGA
jgi:hypothetical protein